MVLNFVEIQYLFQNNHEYETHNDKFNDEKCRLDSLSIAENNISSKPDIKQKPNPKTIK